MASFEQAPPGDVKAGEKIFKTKCAQCHTVDKGAGHKQGQNIHLFYFLPIPFLFFYRLLVFDLPVNLHGMHPLCDFFFFSFSAFVNSSES